MSTYNKITAYSGNEPFIFVSYSHKDSEQVLPIIEKLQDRGFRVWFDQGIEVGTEWPQYIAERLYGSACVLVFMSPNAANSHNCTREINFSIELKKELIVIHLENFEMPLGMRMQLNCLQAMYRERSETLDIFVNELANANMLKVCYDPKLEHADSNDICDTEMGLTASSSRAVGYLQHFVVRLLAYIENGFWGESSLYLEDEDFLLFFTLEKIHVHIWLPEKYKQNLHKQMDLLDLRKGCIKETGFRKMYFNYRIENDELHIYDCPSITSTSYDTIKMLIGNDDNDKATLFAEERFVLREIDLFHKTIKMLLTKDFISKTINCFKEISEKNEIVDKICKIMDTNIEIVRIAEENH